MTNQRSILLSEYNSPSYFTALAGQTVQIHN